MKTLNNFIKCKVDFDDYTDSIFRYTYTSNGNTKTVDVTIVNGENDIEFHINDIPTNLTIDNFIGCEDIEDCTLVIAKHVIKDNNSDILTSFLYDGDSSLTEVDYEKRISPDFEYISNDLEEDNKYTLDFYTNGSFSNSTLFRFYEIYDEDIEKIVELFKTDNSSELSEFLLEYDDEMYEVFNLWGDDENERINYELLDENDDEIDSGNLLISERNVFFDKRSKNYISKQYHPQYIVIYRDEVKKSYYSFSVPKNFQVGGIQFYDSEFIDREILNWDYFGDTVTSLSSFKCCGKTFDFEDNGDNGTYGGGTYGLFKWNTEYQRYELIGEIDD